MDNLPNDFRSGLNDVIDHRAQQQPVSNGGNPAPATGVQAVESFELNSKLSPLAKEFIPSFAMPQQQQQTSHTAGAYFYNNVQPSMVMPNHAYYNNSFEPQMNELFVDEQQSGSGLHNGVSLQNGFADTDSNHDSTSDDFVALHELKGFIDTIASNPAEYEILLPYITDVLNQWVNEDPDIILQCVVNTIVDQAIIDTNFRYNGVRFCLHLSTNLNVSCSQGTFKQMLLRRCQREHLRRESLAVASDRGAYLRGLTFFMGDLCTKMPDKELTQAVPDLLHSLISQRSVDNIRTCNHVLKLCGPTIDAFAKANNSTAVDDLFNTLSQILDSKSQNESIITLIKNIIDLRNNNWVAPQTAHASAPNPYANGGHKYQQTPENFLNYDFGPCGDENNEDVCDAFEEFLKNSGQL